MASRLKWHHTPRPIRKTEAARPIQQSARVRLFIVPILLRLMRQKISRGLGEASANRLNYSSAGDHSSVLKEWHLTKAETAFRSVSILQKFLAQDAARSEGRTQ